MKYIEKEIYKILYDRTASGFEKKLNSAIEDLEDYNPKVTISESRPSGFLAYLTYTIEHKTPENVADELQIRGLSIKCEDCPYLERTQDRRKKSFKCEFATYGKTFLDSPACNKFYEDLIAMFYKSKQYDHTEVKELPEGSYVLPDPKKRSIL